ncbi:EamA family transporter [Candidatus Woesearchaeota archaeon]|nr:EamA family transporter [Candidatus Woesearchaeota archaeon]
MANTLIAVALVFTATLIGAFGALFFKKASATIRRHIGSFLTNINLYIGGFLYALSTVFFIPALKFGDLSLVYPLTSLTYIWVTILSSVYLKEKINAYKIAGIALIFVGIAAIGIGS